MFPKNRNKPFDLVDLDMDFTIVRNQEGGSRFVLVADVSGSMALCVCYITIFNKVLTNLLIINIEMVESD